MVITVASQIPQQVWEDNRRQPGAIARKCESQEVVAEGSLQPQPKLEVLLMFGHHPVWDYHSVMPTSLKMI